MTVLLQIAAALLAGLMMTRLINYLRLPDVTAYLLAGLVMGPSVLGRLGVPGLGFATVEAVEALSQLSDVALGFIAFAIGSEFKLSHLRRTGKAAVVVGVVQALTATLLVDAVLLALHAAFDAISVPAALTLGAIAAATAPAATLMVVRQYKAKGPVTDILLPVVALDDAVGLAVFAVSFGAAKSILGGAADMAAVILAPLAEIALSALLGSLAGAVLMLLERLFHSNRNRNAMIVAFILLTVAISNMNFTVSGLELGFSPLLVCMMMGTVFCNTSPLSDDMMDRADRWSSPLLALFFVLSGAQLDLTVLGDKVVLGVGVLYLIARSAGKYLGAYFSTTLMRCEPTVRRELGITLLPQAGVALGMCAQAAAELGDEGKLVRNIVLMGVLVYELVGPTLTKAALTRAGEIIPPDEAVRTRRARLLKEAKK